MAKVALAQSVRVTFESPDQPDVVALIGELDVFQDALYPTHLLKEYKRNTNIGVGIGWLVVLLGNVMLRSQAPSVVTNWVGVVLVLGGGGLFIWGCGQYAKGKGYSGYWGALGLLYIIGLIVLVLMPDRHKVS
jgi:hypothetical protein